MFGFVVFSVQMIREIIKSSFCPVDHNLNSATQYAEVVVSCKTNSFAGRGDTAISTSVFLTEHISTMLLNSISEKNTSGLFQNWLINKEIKVQRRRQKDRKASSTFTVHALSLVTLQQYSPFDVLSRQCYAENSAEKWYWNRVILLYFIGPSLSRLGIWGWRGVYVSVACLW